MNIKKLIKEIVKNEIKAILNENRNLHPRRMEELKSIGENAKKVLLNKGGTKEGLQTEVYHYITKFYEEYESLDSLRPFDKEGKPNPNFNKNLKQDLQNFWQDTIDNILNQGKSVGWRINTESPEWTQFDNPKKQTTQRTSKNTANYKLYFTLKRGENFQDFLKSARKIPSLLLNINNKPIKGEVSFKISNFIVPALHHMDNIVIHFKNKEDKELLEKAVTDTGFDLVDRGSLGRVSFGVDPVDQGGKKLGSDSQIVAEKVVDNIISNKNALLNYLSKPSDSKEYRQGLSAIENIISTVSKNSSHRNI